MLKEIYRSNWFNLEGYLACTVIYDNKERKTVLQHREILEKKIGRVLNSHESAHHKNGNKRDNRPENIEVLTRSVHASIHHKDIEWVTIACTYCGNQFRKQAKEERARIKKGRAGPFCGKACMGKWFRESQIRKGIINLRNLDKNNSV
jgi:hypothetical protein